MINESVFDSKTRAGQKTAALLRETMHALAQKLGTPEAAGTNGLEQLSGLAVTMVNMDGMVRSSVAAMPRQEDTAAMAISMALLRDMLPAADPTIRPLAEQAVAILKTALELRTGQLLLTSGFRSNIRQLQ